jgi:hypothetical protein
MRPQIGSNGKHGEKQDKTNVMRISGQKSVPYDDAKHDNTPRGAAEGRGGMRRRCLEQANMRYVSKNIFY